MLWFNFILGLIFIFFCINFIIIHYYTQKQKKIKIKPRIKLNHNISLLSKRFHMVSEQRKTGFGRARNEMRAKKWKRGEGEGKEGNACRQTPRFWKPAFASERSAWLARSKICFILRGRYGTWQWLLFILVGKICLSSPPPLRFFTCAIFCAVFDSRSSFFAPKPHGNACYAGYHNIHTEIVVGTLWCRLLLKVCRISCILLHFFKDLSSNNIRDLPEDLFASLRDLQSL